MDATKKVINEVKSTESKLCATAKEYRHNACEANDKDNERKKMERENAWMQPKKCVSKKCMCETHGRKEHENENNNNHEILSDEEEKEEE